MGRYGDSTVLLGLLKPNATVAISLWKLSDGSAVTLSSSACAEIGSTGIFRWATSNIQTQPTVETEYVYKMLNSGLATDFHMGKFALKCEFGSAITKEEIREEMDDNSAKLALLTGMDTNIEAIVTDLDDPDQYKADVSNLDVAVSTRNATTPPTTTAIKNELEGVGTKLTAVKGQTDKLQFAVGTDIKATLDGEEVTTDTASRNASKADVSNLDVAVSTRSAHPDPTAAIKGIPGKTNQEVFDNEKGTDGAYTGTPPTVDEIRTELEQAGTKISDIKTQTDKMGFSGSNDIKATLDGEEVTTDLASRNASKADVSNLDIAVSTRSSHADPTNAIKGAPGKTIQEAYDNERGTEGANTVTPPSVAEIRAEIEGAGTKLTDVKEQTDKMNFTGTDIKATLDGEEVTLNATTEAQLNTIEEEVKRTLGLVHENIYIDLPGYDTNKNLVSARLRTYSVPGSVGTANDIIATYTITATGAGKGKFTSWKMVKQ